jgi:hypothetical protein
MALASGTKLGPYEIIAPLRAGGMGVAYRARDLRLDREVAVKVLRRTFPPTRHCGSGWNAKRERFRSCPILTVVLSTTSDNRMALTSWLWSTWKATLEQRLSKGPLPLEQIELGAARMLFRCNRAVGTVGIISPSDVSADGERIVLITTPEAPQADHAGDQLDRGPETLILKNWSAVPLCAKHPPRT